MKLGVKLMCAIIFILTLSLGMMNHTPAATIAKEPLGVAMEATGAKIEECSIHSWVKLSNAKLSNDQLEETVHRVMEELGVEPQNYQLIHEQKKQCSIVKAEMINKNFHVLVVVQVNQVEGNIPESDGYLVVNIEAKAAENLSVSNMQEKILHITKKNGDSPQITTCLIGWLDGKLRDGDWHELLNDAFMAIDARVIDTLESKQFASYTGFTPEITEWLQVGDHKVNLNMAMRYSQYDHRTYVTIGSPIITQEY